MNHDAKIYLAWHRGLVGSALMRQLEKAWYTNILTRTHDQIDLTDHDAVSLFFATEKPEYVFLAAAKVGGIMANNTSPADFLYTNLQIQNNVIHNAWKHGVTKLLFLWSSCIYPKLCPQPMKEEYLLTWPLEPTNEPYAIAKIAGIKMCQSYNRQYGTNFIACMPTNLYGERDNFDLNSSHVLPAMIRKFHEAKVNSTEVTLWWDWSALREFLYVDDMAEACIFMMKNFNPTKEQNEAGDVFLNIGSGQEVSIKELALTIKETIWYQWEIVRDTTKPNGTPRKLLDTSRLTQVWWTASMPLRDGIKHSYERYLTNYTNK